jgi:hypothetical protein
MKLTNHQISGTIFNLDSTMVDMIMNEIISNVKMASLLSTGLSTILFKEHCTLIVLIYDIVRQFDTLVGTVPKPSVRTPVSTHALEDLSKPLNQDTEGWITVKKNSRKKAVTFL